MTTASQAAELFLLDRNRLDESKRRIAKTDPSVTAAWTALRTRAEAVLSEAPESVMDKQAVPASGDRHDFASLAVYWWPNPDTADGMPYVRRDGRINPQVADYDWPAWVRATERMRVLTLAWFFGGDRRFATAAAAHARAWFIDPATAMNPNLQYAACIPGRNDGRCFGIIHVGQPLPALLDLLDLLGESGAWTEADAERFRSWLGELHAWLTTSDRGRHEDEQNNNHGVFYDRFVVALALRLGLEHEAAARLAAIPQRRLAVQIEPDGRMPRELKRTRSWHYATMNLRGLFGLASMGERVSVDLWHAQPLTGGGLREAVRWLFDHARSRDAWPHTDIDGPDYGGFTPLAEQARTVYGDPFDPAAFQHRLTDPQREAQRLHHLTGRHDVLH